MAPILRTVGGDVAPTGIRAALVHEHLHVDLSRWVPDADVVLLDSEAVSEEVTVARRAGVDLVVDCTTRDIGRNVWALERIARESGCLVIAGTGLYRELTYPDWLDRFDDERLASLFVSELVDGIDGSTIRAGVIGEIGTSEDAVTWRERAVIRAAGEAHRRTGAPVLSHTCAGALALEQLDLFLGAGVAPSSLAIGHLDSCDAAVHLAVAEAGAYVGFDQIGYLDRASDEERVDRIVALVEAGHEDRILVSGDLVHRSKLSGRGGAGYAQVLTGFAPRLASAGLSPEVVTKLTVTNPLELLAFEPR